jgi:anti-anti-sigma factor
VSEFNFTSRVNGDELRPLIEIRLSQPSEPGYAAVAKLCGEHDISTSADVQKALSPIFGNVLVDLTDCEFIDSTVIAALIVDFQLRRREGHRLELLVPPQNRTIARTLEISGVADLMTVHSALPGSAQLLV